MAFTNWSKVLLRSSCAGKVMTEGRATTLTEKQAELLETLEKKEKITEAQTVTLASLRIKRDAPPTLSDTCVSYLREIYQREKYGKESIGGAQRSNYVRKGNLMEVESIMLLSRFYEFDFEKNTERKNDLFKTGECDIECREQKKIIDVKSVWDMESLLSHVPNPEKPNQKLFDDAYEWQGQCYMDLWDAETHDVCYTLVNMPQEIIEGEKWKIRNVMQPVTDEAPDFLEAIERLENNCTFDEIPPHERIVKFTFQRDTEMIRKLHSRWEDCRIWLEKFEQLHMTLNT